MDNTYKQTIVLAKLNAVLDIICYATDQKVKLDKELKKLKISPTNIKSVLNGIVKQGAQRVVPNKTRKKETPKKLVKTVKQSKSSKNSNGQFKMVLLIFVLFVLMFTAVYFFGPPALRAELQEILF